MLKLLLELEISKKDIVFLLLCNAYIALAGVLVSYGIQMGVDIALGNSDKSIVFISIYIVAIAIFFIIFMYNENVLSAKIGENIGFKVREKGVKWLIVNDLIGEKATKGEVLQMFEEDSKNIADSLQKVYIPFITAVITITFSFVYIFIVSWQLFLVVAVLAPLSLFLSYRYTKAVGENFEKAVAEEEKFKTLLEQIFSNMSNLKVFKAFNNVDKKVDKQFDEKMKYLKKQFYAFAMMTNISFAFINFSKIILLIIGMMFMSKGFITFGILLGVWNIFTNIVWTVVNVPDVLYHYKTRDISFKRIRKFFYIEHSETREDNVVMHGETYLNLNNVYFKYENTEKNVIKNFNYTFKNNEITYILGESGVGKSTLLKLLIGLYKPQQGNINIVSGEVSYEEYGYFTAYVPQTIIFYI